MTLFYRLSIYFFFLHPLLDTQRAVAAQQKASPSLLFGARRDCSSLGEAGRWQQAPGVVQL